MFEFYNINYKYKRGWNFSGDFHCRPQILILDKVMKLIYEMQYNL